jgi:tRNA(adenine34) deaminase
MTQAQDKRWITEALHEAELAMTKGGELPIAAILVEGDQELSRSQTQTRRQSSMVAHGELFALLKAGNQVFSAKRPLIIYTTLEPCLMCIGAAMQCGVDEIVFSMPAIPDGGARYVDEIIRGGQKAPKVRGGILIDQALVLMRQFVRENPTHFGYGYAKALVDGLEQ